MGYEGSYAGAQEAGVQPTEGHTHDNASDKTENHDDMGYKSGSKPSRSAEKK